MERLQGPINSFWFGEHLEANCLEQSAFSASIGNFKFRGIEDEQFPGLEDEMPFSQMLQSVETPLYFTLKEPNFQTLRRLQHLRKPLGGINFMPKMETQMQMQALELESCVTHDMLEIQSPTKSESNPSQHPHSDNQGHRASVENGGRDVKAKSTTARPNPPTWPKQTKSSNSSHLLTKERRKRKRTRPAKNKEDIENQRMTHIAVERNRRRQMNDHLSVLRSLMPPSYIQRGDQASIIGGAIDFVKELEHLLQSLEAQKRVRNGEAFESSTAFLGPSIHDCGDGSYAEGDCGQGMKAESKSDAADIEVTMIQTHVNLKIQCEKKPGLLLKTILSLEDLRLAVLHLNITSSQDSVLYTFSLKIEDDCKLGSANEIAEAVQQAFSFKHDTRT